MRWRLALVAWALTVWATAAIGQAPRPWTVVSAEGKEAALANAKFTQGTRSLPMGPGGFGDKTATEYLEFRDDRSTLFANGVLSWIPLASLESLEFDAVKKVVKAKVKTAGGSEELAGTSKFVGINKFVADYEQELSGLGKALLKFRVGEPKSPSVTFRLGGAVAVPAVPKGRKASIVAADKEKTKHEIVEAQPLYQTASGFEVVPQIRFQVDVKVPWDKLREMKALPTDKKQSGSSFAVTIGDGSPTPLILWEPTAKADAKAPRLFAIVGRTATGYKAFPMHTIAELKLD